MGQTSKYLQLEKELKEYTPLLTNASKSMRDSDVSDYPIFVAHKQEIELGIKLIERDGEAFLWSINISSLEEMVAKRLVLPEKVEDFRSVYKEPDEFLCFFVISELGASFVYMPCVITLDKT